MSKAAKLQRAVGGNIAQSVGATEDAPRPRIAAATRGPRAKYAENFMDVPRELIRPDPAQPRKTFEDSELEALAASLKTSGQLQALDVIAEPDGAFTIVAGESRWRAAALAGLDSLACRVRTRAEIDAAGPGAVRLAQLAENWIRSDPPALEMAEALAELVGQGFTQAQLAAALGRSQPTISNRLRLLELPERTRFAVQSGEIDPDTAVILGRLRDPAKIASYTRTAIEHKWSRAHARETVALALKADAAAVTPRELPDPRPARGLEHDQAGAQGRGAGEVISREYRPDPDPPAGPPAGGPPAAGGASACVEPTTTKAPPAPGERVSAVAVRILWGGTEIGAGGRHLIADAAGTAYAVAVAPVSGVGPVRLLEMRQALAAALAEVDAAMSGPQTRGKKGGRR